MKILLKSVVCLIGIFVLFLNGCGKEDKITNSDSNIGKNPVTANFAFDTTAVAFAGLTNQNYLVAFNINCDTLKKVVLKYKTLNNIESESSREGNKLAILSDYEFSYKSDEWSITGEWQTDKFVGTWETNNQTQSGTWEATQCQSIIAKYDTLQIKVGNSVRNTLKTGLEPFVILVPPDPAIAVNELTTFLVNEGLTKIKGISPGTTSMTFGDASVPQLTLTIPIIVTE